MKKLSLVLVLVMILNVFSCVSVFAADEVTKTAASTNRTVHLTGISNATTGIFVKWNGIDGATGYRVYRRGAGETSWTYLTTVKTTYYTDGKVYSGHYYRYTVIATFGNVFGGYESGLYIKRLVNPYSIKAANGESGVNVTWGRVNGADSYFVYRRAAGEPTWTRVAVVKTTSYADVNVKNGTYYKYTVRAVSGSTLSYFHDGSLIKYVATPKVNRLTTGSNSVSVYWNAIGGATGYNVYRRSQGQNGWTYLATVTTTTYVDTTVAKNNYYRYTVRAKSGGYISGFFANGPVIKFIGVAGVTVPNNGSSGNGGSQQEKPMTSEQIFNLYKNAVVGVKNNGKAGYTKKSWESINDVHCSNSSLQSTLESLLNDMITIEADAEAYAFTKGTQDAKDAFPGCGATLSQIKSISCTESGTDYIVKIQMKPQTNPRRTDTSGIATMSGNVLYYDDIRDAMDSSGVNTGSNSCSVTYNDFVIEARISKDGKFVSVKEYANINTRMYVSGTDTRVDMNVYTSYINFKY